MAVVFFIVYARYRKIRIALPMIFIVAAEIAITIGIAASSDAAVWGVVLVANLVIASLAWWKLHETDMAAMAGAIAIPFMGAIFPGSWVIDLSAIGGIVAAIGTGIDDQIVIADEALHGRKEDTVSKKGVLYKIKSAFFIVFGSAATLIAAMIPLVSLGTGLVRGFAITTIVGVLVGVLITRPAYAKIVENVVK
ncbi:MAG: hypothetical protein HY367_03340 [Candidatus Aenigmarchaeota archaeon]|nr:hypothetical protein [Candidatus Aenigmarchaeota archaeon]